MTAATIDELYKELQGIEAWIERAQDEVAELHTDECSYEYQRACVWLGTLEDRRDRRRQWIEAKANPAPGIVAAREQRRLGLT